MVACFVKTTSHLSNSSKVEKACSGRGGDMLCHVQFAFQENTEVTNHIGWWNTALRVKIKMLCCIVIHYASAVKPNQFYFCGIQFQTHGRKPGLGVMDACCHFHFYVLEIFATEFYVEHVLSIQVNHEAMLKSNVYNVRGVQNKEEWTKN